MNKKGGKCGYGLHEDIKLIRSSWNKMRFFGDFLSIFVSVDFPDSYRKVMVERSGKIVQTESGEIVK